MKRNIIKLSLLSTLMIGLVGCGGGSSSTVSNGGNPSTLYTAFSPLVNTRADKLYKTNGTVAGSSEVSNIMVPSDATTNSNFKFEKLEGFSIYGEYLYFKSAKKYDDGSLLGVTYTENTYSTNLSDDSTVNIVTATPHIIGIIHGDSTKSIEVNGATYTISGTGGNYQVDKILSDGTRTNVDLSSIPTYSPYFLNTIAKVNNDIYFFAYSGSTITNITNSMLVKFNTVTGNLDNTISVLQNVQPVRMTSVGTKLIFWGTVLGTAGIYTYETTTPTIAPVLINADVIHNAKEFVTFNGELYFIATVANAITFYKIDTVNDTAQSIATTASATGYKGTFTYNGELYFISGGKLASLNTTSSQITVITDTLLSPMDNDAAAVEANGKLYFSCDIDTSALIYDMELCQYDGTSVTTAQNINGGGSSYPTHFSNLDGELIFQASQDGTNNKLFHYDGTTLTVLN